MTTNRDFYGEDALEAVIDKPYVCVYYKPGEDTMALVAMFESDNPFEGLEQWLNSEVDFKQVRCLYSMEDLYDDKTSVNF